MFQWVGERTKEIGIMRALGVRKKDITHIFNVEAGLIGLFSVIFGAIVVSLLSQRSMLLLENF